MHKSTLEVVDTRMHTMAELPLSSKDGKSTQVASEVIAALSLSPNHETGQSLVAALDTSGSIRVFDTNPTTLSRSLQEWKEMVGLEVREGRMQQGVDGSLKARSADEKGKPKFGIDKPKHGKEDPKNEPHVGGNTWAGGGEPV